MGSLPTIVVQFITFNRAEYAKRTLLAALRHLRYQGEILWYLSDAGSDDDQYTNHIDILNQHGGDLIFGGHTEKMKAGANWNKSCLKIYEKHPIYLRLEDDFELTEDIDITPYVRVLLEREDVGMVRMGLMPIQLDLHTHGHEGQIYLDCLKSTPYCYSGNPALIHERFHDAYGFFSPVLEPGECEVHMDNLVRHQEGPAIWRPINLGSYSPFAHIGEKQSYQ